MVKNFILVTLMMINFQCKEERDITALYDPETQKIVELVPSAKIRTTIIADSISIPKPNELPIEYSGKIIPKYYTMNNPQTKDEKINLKNFNI